MKSKRRSIFSVSVGMVPLGLLRLHDRCEDIPQQGLSATLVPWSASIDEHCISVMPLVLLLCPGEKGLSAPASTTAMSENGDLFPQNRGFSRLSRPASTARGVRAAATKAHPAECMTIVVLR